MDTKRVIIIFLDGVGLGSTNPEVNPFMHFEMTSIRALLGISHLTRAAIGTVSKQAAVLGLDALLDVPGLPQSATGQTSILTGQNTPAMLGEHYGPYPNQTLRGLLVRDNLFKTMLDLGRPVAYANAYPERFLDRVKRGKGRMSANTFAAHMSGLKLRSTADLQQGRAITALFSNDYWPEPEVKLPPLTAHQAGQNLAALALDHVVTFLEFWYSDYVGHKMDREQSLQTISMLDDFLAGVVDSLDLAQSLLLVVSDHGNFEDWTTKKHTQNPALALLVGTEIEGLVPTLQRLTDIKPAVVSYLAEAS